MITEEILDQFSLRELLLIKYSLQGLNYRQIEQKNIMNRSMCSFLMSKIGLKLKMKRRINIIKAFRAYYGMEKPK